jgi:prevent-host-death family protein
MFGNLGINQHVPVFSREALMNTQVNIGQVKRDISELVNRVSYAGERIILTSRGKLKAALIGIKDYERLQKSENREGEIQKWLADTRALSTKIEKRQGQVLSNLARRSLNAAAPQKRSGLRGGVPVLPSRGELITLQLDLRWFLKTAGEMNCPSRLSGAKKMEWENSAARFRIGSFLFSSITPSSSVNRSYSAIINISPSLHPSIA